MPAEWEPHAGTWLSFPRPEGISFPGLYERVPALWLRMIEEISTGEDVHVNVLDADDEARVAALLDAAPRVARARVRLHRIPTNEPWCRDHGPIFVTRPGEVAVVDWGYNAWGGKYPPFDRDDAVPARVAELLGLRAFRPGLVMEGGSLDVNGRGTLLTTESCLLNPNRNPTFDRAAIASRLGEFLGVRHVIWLGDGIAGDDTDGHVDDITRFVAPDTIVTVVEPDPADENHRPLRENLERLRAARDQDGRPFTILELPMPRPVVRDDQRLPASYANFYVANAVVLVPTFADPNDEAALALLRRCFPSRRVVGVDSRDLVWGLGAFHCATQQQPEKPA
ncbi:MAG: agmatine deiminase family protein [Deltaproteobacteria bacterium]|nr:agmatine deiminase family protein [Deltaproteobacteria bacterium]